MRTLQKILVLLGLIFSFSILGGASTLAKTMAGTPVLAEVMLGRNALTLSCMNDVTRTSNIKDDRHMHVGWTSKAPPPIKLERAGETVWGKCQELVVAGRYTQADAMQSRASGTQAILPPVAAQPQQPPATKKNVPSVAAQIPAPAAHPSVKEESRHPEYGTGRTWVDDASDVASHTWQWLTNQLWRLAQVILSLITLVFVMRFWKQLTTFVNDYRLPLAFVLAVVAVVGIFLRVPYLNFLHNHPVWTVFWSLAGIVAAVVGGLFVEAKFIPTASADSSAPDPGIEHAKIRARMGLSDVLDVVNPEDGARPTTRHNQTAYVGQRAEVGPPERASVH